MDDPGHDNDFPDLSSFDDESSVISVSAILPNAGAVGIEWPSRGDG